MSTSMLWIAYISAVNYCDAVRYTHSIFEPLYYDPSKIRR